MIYIYNNQYDLEHEILNLFCDTCSAIHAFFPQYFLGILIFSYSISGAAFSQDYIIITFIDFISSHYLLWVFKGIFAFFSQRIGTQFDPL